MKFKSLFLHYFLMHKMSRSTIRSINRSSKNWKNEITPRFAQVPPLQKECWYVAQFRNFKEDGRLVVSQNSNNPVIVLNGYNGGSIERDRKVICEVSHVGPSCAFGEFKEFYEKNPNSYVY